MQQSENSEEFALQLEQCVEGLQVYSNCCKANSDGSAAVADAKNDNAQRLINTLQAAHHVRNRSRLAATMTAFQRMMFPDALQGFVKAVSRRPVSGGTISKTQVKLDCAFSLLYRDVWKSQSGPLYLFTDSSPQLGTDWLMSIVDYVPDEKLAECFEQALELKRSISRLEIAVSQQDEAELTDVVQSRHHAGSIISASIHRHRQQPMGLGNTSAEDKCRAIALKFAHESHSLSDLKSHIGRVCSFTVDLGEASTPDIAGGPVENYLPPWVFGPQRGLVSDELCWEDIAGQEEPDSGHMFKRGLIVAGLDHVCNNLQSELDSHLISFQQWLPGFRALAHLLSHRHLLKRLIGRCIIGGPFENTLPRMFETAMTSVAHWRWGTIVNALPDILSRFKALSLVWNQAKFQQSSSASPEGPSEQAAAQTDDELDCSIITATLKDEHFFVYSQMLLALHQIANFISAWGSGCSCHEFLLGSSEKEGFANALSAARREMGLQECFDGPGFDCKMKGRRAPELASGLLKELMLQKAEEERARVLVESASLKNKAAQDTVMQEFETGVNMIFLQLDIKLSFWEDLPWKMCALGVSDLAQQKHHARAVLALFNKFADTCDPKFHHRLTWQMLRPDCPVRSQLEEFASCPDTPLAAFPVLQEQVATLAFIPVVERVIEGAHSLVKRYSGFRKVTGGYISLAERLPEIEKLLDDPGSKEKLVASFISCYKLRKLAQVMRFDSHPEWQRAVDKTRLGSQGSLQKVANAIVYSTDPTNQYLPMHSVRKKNEQSKKAQATNSLEFQALTGDQQQQQALCEDSVLAWAWVQHVNKLLKPGDVLSIPIQEGDPLPGILPLCNSGQAQPEQVRDVLLSLAASASQGQPPKLFIKVLSCHASSLKTVKRAPSGRQRLHRGDMAVTVHRATWDSQAISLESRPSLCSSAGDAAQILGVMGQGAKSSSLKNIEKRRQKLGEQPLTLPIDLPSDSARTVLSKLLRDFLAERACEGHSGGACAPK